MHAFIICWTGQEGNARSIAASIKDHVNRLTVIYSNKNDQTETGDGDWVQVPDAWFYGRKFEKCLQLHSSGVMLQIQADACFGNWPLIVSRCGDAYAQYSSLGIWAPNVWQTHWIQERVAIANVDGTELSIVACTDGIVWALAEKVCARLKDLNYQENNLGWGIDWAASAHAYANNMLVLRDLSVMVQHPHGTGYSRELAAQQMNRFLTQLTVQEQVQLAILNRYQSSAQVNRS